MKVGAAGLGPPILRGLLLTEQTCDFIPDPILGSSTKKDGLPEFLGGPLEQLR